MKDKEFNLLYEPWIAVLDKNGNSEEVGLIEVFERAHEIKMLSGELPTQDFATLRLLLAIMYAVFLRKNLSGVPAKIREEEDAIERWSSLWNLGHFPPGIIEAYLNEYEERFYLRHPERPFYQVHIEKGTEYGAPKLIGDVSESNNKVRLFPVRSGSGKESVTLAEASRWLIYTNAFDDTSAKPSVRAQKTPSADASADTPAPVQKMPSVGAGWLGRLGLISARGKTLFETLLMNFLTWDVDRDRPFPDGKAIWELDNPRSEERVEIKTPDNPLSLLTLQSRRLRLFPDKGEITGYRLLGGDVFPKENAFIENMTLWRQNKGANGNEFVPKRHDPARALWRDFSSLAAQGPDVKRPGVVDWVSKLKSDGLLPDELVIFQTASVKYGDKDFFVDDVFSDSVAMNAHMLTKIGSSWTQRIIDIVAITDNCVWKFGKFAMDLAKANGDDDENNLKGVSRNAREEAFFKLDIPFRTWLLSIDPYSDVLEPKLEEWTKTMKHALLYDARKIVEETGERAFLGKVVKENAPSGKTIRITAFSAYRNFYITLNKIIGGE